MAPQDMFAQLRDHLARPANPRQARRGPSRPQLTGHAVVGIALALALGVALALSVGVALAAKSTPHPIDGRENCLACHDVGAMKPMPADHKGRTNEVCVTCHQPAGSGAAAAPTQAPPTPTAKAPDATPTAAPAATRAPAAPTATPAPTKQPEAKPTPLAAPTDSAGCLACHQEQTLATRLGGGDVLPANVSPDKFGQSVHGSKLSCTACHPDKTTIPHQPVTAENRVQYQMARTQVCATCHRDVTATYWDSVHGKLVAAGRPDAPTCVTCHSREANAHSLEVVDGANSPTADRNVASQVCGQCHSQEFANYNMTFHGKSMRLGARTDAATCVDCHGSYGVKRVHGAEKQVDQTTMAQACAQCHPGADEKFAQGWPGHEKPSPSWFPAAFFTERFLFFLTVGVVGFGIVHVELDVLRWAVNRIRRRGRSDPGRSATDDAHKEATDGQK